MQDGYNRADIVRIFEKLEENSRQLSAIHTRQEVFIAQRSADQLRWDERHDETSTTIAALRADITEIQKESRHQLWWAFTALAGALGAIVMSAWEGMKR